MGLENEPVIAAHNMSLISENLINGSNRGVQLAREERELYNVLAKLFRFELDPLTVSGGTRPCNCM